MDDEDDDYLLYCVQCTGESFACIGTPANGRHWKCRDCGHEVISSRRPPVQPKGDL